MKDSVSRTSYNRVENVVEKVQNRSKTTVVVEDLAWLHFLQRGSVALRCAFSGLCPGPANGHPRCRGHHL